MTDRIKGLIVVLEQDWRDDDVQSLVDAIAQFRRIASVHRQLALGIDDQMIRSRVVESIREAILAMLNRVQAGKPLP